MHGDDRLQTRCGIGEQVHAFMRVEIGKAPVRHARPSVRQKRNRTETFDPATLSARIEGDTGEKGAGAVARIWPEKNGATDGT
ncbi:hypothetical protein GCM10020258_28630 [Sphingomonas yabuuchiae]